MAGFKMAVFLAAVIILSRGVSRGGVGPSSAMTVPKMNNMTMTTTISPYFVGKPEFMRNLSLIFDAGKGQAGRAQLTMTLVSDPLYMEIVELEFLLRAVSVKKVGEPCSVPDPVPPIHPTNTDPAGNDYKNYLKWQKKAFLDSPKKPICSELDWLVCVGGKCACALPTKLKAERPLCVINEGVECADPSVLFPDTGFTSALYTRTGQDWADAFRPANRACSPNSACDDGDGALFFPKTAGPKICVLKVASRADPFSTAAVKELASIKDRWTLKEGEACKNGEEDDLFAPSKQTYPQRFAGLSKLKTVSFCNFKENAVCKAGRCTCLPPLIPAGKGSTASGLACVFAVPSDCDVKTVLPPHPRFPNDKSTVKIPAVVLDVPACGYGSCVTYGKEKDCVCPAGMFGNKCDQMESKRGLDRGIGPKTWQTVSDRTLRHALIRDFSAAIKSVVKKVEEPGLRMLNEPCVAAEDKPVDTILMYLEEAAGSAPADAAKLKDLLSMASASAASKHDFCFRPSLLECSAGGKCECQSETQWDASDGDPALAECRLKQDVDCYQISKCAGGPAAAGSSPYAPLKNEKMRPACASPLICRKKPAQKDPSCQKAETIGAEFTEEGKGLQAERVVKQQKVGQRRTCNVDQEMLARNTFVTYNEALAKYKAGGLCADFLDKAKADLDKDLGTLTRSPRLCDLSGAGPATQEHYCRPGVVSGRCRCRRVGTVDTICSDKKRSKPGGGGQSQFTGLSPLSLLISVLISVIN